MTSKQNNNLHIPELNNSFRSKMIFAMLTYYKKQDINASRLIYATTTFHSPILIDLNIEKISHAVISLNLPFINIVKIVNLEDDKMLYHVIDIPGTDRKINYIVTPISKINICGTYKEESIFIMTNLRKTLFVFQDTT